MDKYIRCLMLPMVVGCIIAVLGLLVFDNSTVLKIGVWMEGISGFSLLLCIAIEICFNG